MRERARLTHQPVDDVPIIDAMFMPTVQTRQTLHATLAVPHFQVLGVNPDIDTLAAKPAVHRVKVALHAHQAPLRHRHADALATLLTPRRQGPQQRPFLGQPFMPTRVPPPRNLTQKGQVFFPTGEIPSATQHQRLLHRLLEMPMR